MRPADVGKRVGAFALVALLVAGAVAGAAALTGAASDDGFTSAELSVEGHQSPVVASQPTETGQIDVSADASGKVVVVDDAHGNDVSEIQLRPLVNALTEAGHTVKFYRPERGPSGRTLNATLRNADAFVSLAPANRFGSGEADALSAFLDAGGRVLLAGEPEGASGAASVLGITVSVGGAASTAEFAPAVSPHGVTVGSGYLYDLTENVNNHANVPVTPTGSGALTEGVDRVVVSVATPVTGPNVLLRTQPTAELSTTRDRGRYGVLARNGNLTVLGDASVFDPDWAYVADNEVLLGNLADFLVSGDRSPMPEPTGGESGPRRPA
ncbi:MAG: DUF4350 domain-containing protein [Halobacterium sp.]